MKNTLCLAILLGFVFVLFNSVWAQENIEENISVFAEEINESEIEAELVQDPGITPDSPLWGIDVALDRLAFRLSTGPKKAELGLKIARERLTEMKRMQERNKIRECEKAIEMHEEVMAEVNNAIVDIGNNQTIYGIQRGMQNHIAALQKIMIKIAENPNISPEVKNRLENKIRAQITKAQAVEAKVVAKREEIQNKTRIEERERERNRTRERNETQAKNETQVQSRERNRSGR